MRGDVSVGVGIVDEGDEGGGGGGVEDGEEGGGGVVCYVDGEVGVGAEPFVGCL